MTAHHDLDRELTAFLREGPTELPDESLDAVFDRTEQTRQRVVIGPWRLPDMNKFVTYGLGAVAVVVLLFVGSQFFGEAGGLFGAEPTPTPTPEATLESTPEPTASPEPSPSPPPPLTQSFTSTLHGISLSYPEGWFSEAATEPWTGGQVLFREPPADFLYDPTLNDHLFLFIASQSIGNSTPDDWVAQQLAGYECTGVRADHRGRCHRADWRRRLQRGGRDDRRSRVPRRALHVQRRAMAFVYVQPSVVRRAARNRAAPSRGRRRLRVVVPTVPLRGAVTDRDPDQCPGAAHMGRPVRCVPTLLHTASAVAERQPSSRVWKTHLSRRATIAVPLHSPARDAPVLRLRARGAAR